MKEDIYIKIAQLIVLILFVLSLRRQFILAKRVQVVEDTSEFLHSRIANIDEYLEDDIDDQQQERQDEIISIAISMSLDSVQKIPSDSVLTINLPTEFRQNVARAREMYDTIVDHYHRMENIPK